MLKISAIRLCFIIFIVLLSGCQASQIAQTSSATEINKYKDLVIKDLKVYKQKLDLRNPYAYNPKLSDKILKEIKTSKNTLSLTANGKKLLNENEYLYYAFLPDNVQYRNDFLILGLYKLIYKAYKLDYGHKVTAFEYDSEYMQDLYKILQVVRWKVRTNKRVDGKYLFLTWQNNWQVELMENPVQDLNKIRDLAYIKDKRETIFDPSNFSFEILISQMITNVKYSLEEVDIEPTEMSVSALKTFIFII